MFLNVNHYKSIITWDSSLANIYLTSKSNLRTLRLLLFSCHAISSEERLLRLVSEELFCKIIEDTFPELEATVGGQISIDIYPKGKNKAQVLQDIIGPITFFGDKCQPGGNDYPIVERLGQMNEENNLSCTIHEVKDYKETWDILKRK